MNMKEHAIKMEVLANRSPNHAAAMLLVNRARKQVGSIVEVLNQNRPNVHESDANYCHTLLGELAGMSMAANALGLNIPGISSAYNDMVDRARRVYNLSVEGMATCLDNRAPDAFMFTPKERTTSDGMAAVYQSWTYGNTSYQQAEKRALEMTPAQHADFDKGLIEHYKANA